MHEDFRLFQLISPSLPVGAFSYSQGLEYAIELGWVKNVEQFNDWMVSMIEDSLVTLELPILRRMYHAFSEGDLDQISELNRLFYANRETAELRAEEKARGKAMARLLQKLGMNPSSDSRQSELLSQNSLVGFAYACHHWHIDEDKMCSGYLWSWLENATMAGIKLIPLGQSDGQKLMLALNESMSDAIDSSKQVIDEDIGSYTPAQVLASSKHETQYTRLFRS
ncbi:urease accessory protein UreF [Veronia nyctiphanis]|uniref:Urease accessory protein UreF n=1 Tax=Veronia nyctiphanis TaxID=1278244 RepID=A0A4Q0YTR8_9GAMM|nr:urease accessory protein UreF [Veronia nyctiphanis]RXJ74123.1 urease accessory protein UreF [Veronia nyctiphanis]